MKLNKKSTYISFRCTYETKHAFEEFAKQFNSKEDAMLYLLNKAGIEAKKVIFV
jgi:hypothetical protein